MELILIDKIGCDISCVLWHTFNITLQTGKCIIHQPLEAGLRKYLRQNCGALVMTSILRLSVRWCWYSALSGRLCRLRAACLVFNCHKGIFCVSPAPVSRVLSKKILLAGRHYYSSMMEHSTASNERTFANISQSQRCSYLFNSIVY